jgi:hypothetical protein
VDGDVEDPVGVVADIGEERVPVTRMPCGAAQRSTHNSTALVSKQTPVCCSTSGTKS